MVDSNINDPLKSSGLTHQDQVYIAPSTYSMQRAGVEAYLTDEDNFNPYVSPYNSKANTGGANVENEESEESEADENGEYINDQTPTSAYTLHQGSIVETYYYTDLFKLDFEADYKEMSSSATFERDEVNLNQFYKGIRVKLLTEWEEPDTLLTWDDLKDVNIGFITEQTFKEDCVEVKVSGMEALLDQVLNFEFKGLPRSQIIAEILKSAGLNPVIDATGLDDDVLDFVNEKKNSSASGSSGGGQIGNVSDVSISNLAKQLCQGKNTDLEKAQAIHSFICKVQYPPNNYSDHKRCPVEVVRRMESNCCDRARLGHEMANSVGLKNRGVHGPNHVWIQYYINNEWVDSDPSSSRKSLGSIHNNLTAGSVWTFDEC